MMLVPVIMAGGSGTRLWPLSRQQFPKQFLSLTGDDSLLQQTVERLTGLDAAAPLVVCHEAHRFIVAEQLRQVGVIPERILLEPEARNTAASVALAALETMRQDQDPLLLVLAADHYLADIPSFHRSLAKARPLATEGHLVTFGVVPDRAETGYGYIRRGDALGEGFAVAQFEEKPDAATAADYLASGDYWWNSGMFMMRASRYLDELERFRPDILTACRQAHAKAVEDLDFLRLDAEAFAACPAESIDYAVMEPTRDAAVVPLESAWSDVGSWQALWQLGKRDENGNVSMGDVVMHDSCNGYVISQGPLVATLGVDNLVVVATRDAVLVADRERSQDLKALVARLEADGRGELVTPEHVYRPWGHYRVLSTSERYQVKCITVKPGGKLSLQRHHHRAEHWVVVSGTARVTLEDSDFFMTENESTYIPVGKLHSLENPGVMNLELIEVQSGSYLGEDDIVRVADRYGRAP